MPSNIVLPDEIKRLDYYNGQFLHENDFKDEQEYHRTMRLLHNRGLHSWGVVDGFGLSIMLQRNGKFTVSVNPGMAIDADGQEIVLPSTRILEDITSIPWITIKYKPEPVGPQDEHTNRIRESCEVEVKGTKPTDADKSRVIILGTFFVNLQPDYTERQYIPHAVNGNFGIGTTEPKDKLDVAGSAAIGKSFSDSKSKPAPQNGLIVEGKVGIGTVQPQNNLDVTGSVAIGKSFSGSKQAPPDSLIVEGQVGIGTTDLTEKLTVNGKIESKQGGIKFPDGTVQVTASTVSVITQSHQVPLENQGMGNLKVILPSGEWKWLIQVHVFIHQTIWTKAILKIDGSTVQETDELGDTEGTGYTILFGAAIKEGGEHTLQISTVKSSVRGIPRLLVIAQKCPK